MLSPRCGRARGLLRHQGVQHLGSGPGRRGPCGHPGLQPHLPVSRQHRSGRCLGQDRHHGLGRARHPAVTTAARGMAAVSRLSYVVAGFLLCTLLLLTPTGAHAQTSQVLVSNFGQGGATTSGSEHGLAQGFRTGDNTAGYTLTSIELLLGVQTGASPFPTVTLHSGSPTGSEVADFTAPSSATGAAVYTFIPTTTVTLEMNTDYWVVATGGTIGWVWSVTGPGEDATSATGWSIANRGQYFDPDSGSWKDANGDWAFHITANGYEGHRPSSPPNCRLTSPRVGSPRSGTRDRTTAPRWW